MLPKTTTLALIAALAVGGCASVATTPLPAQKQGSYELKDGSVLVVDANGRMRMYDLYRRPLFMKDGVPMELKDGTVVTMQESAMWRALRIRGTLNPRA